MKKLLIVAIAVLFVAPAAWSAQTLTYGWEDGGTILGSYGNVADPTNVSGPQTGMKGDVAPGTWTCPGPHGGDHYMHVAEDPHSSTPQAYVAWIINLVPGDMVYADFWAYDDESADPNPDIRIWAHYSTSDDITNYQGSAGEGLNNSGYTTGTGWENCSSSWEFGTPAGYGAETALVIEFRLYSSPTTSTEYRTDYWGDDITVTAPDHATIIFPEPVSAVESATWSAVKALYR